MENTNPNNDRPRVLIEVRSGISEETYSKPGVGKPEVYVLDWDVVKCGEEVDTPPDWVWPLITDPQDRDDLFASGGPFSEN